MLLASRLRTRNTLRSRRFTLDDLALNDLPAFVDYVLGATGAQRVSTVTWSAVRSCEGPHVLGGGAWVGVRGKGG